MKNRCAAVVAGLLALFGPGPARAEVVLDQVARCIEHSRQSGTVPTACIDTAQADCLSLPAETPAVAILCYARARESWDSGITQRMAEIRATAPEQIAAIAGIEVKYDLLASLVQCDRLEELARLSSQTAETVQRQKARCTATASGLAYMRLLWRSQDLN